MLHGIGISPARFFHNEMIESELTVESGFAVESFFDWSKSTIDELLYNNQNVGTEWWLILSYDTKIVPENTKQKITIDFEAEGSTFTALKELIEIQNSEKGRSISKSRFVLYYRYSNGANLTFIPLEIFGPLSINELDIMMMLKVCRKRDILLFLNRTSNAGSCA